MKTIGDKIKKRLLEITMTQKALAKKARKYEHHISNIINNKVQPDFSTLKDIAKALGVNLSSLVDDIK